MVKVIRELRLLESTELKLVLIQIFSPHDLVKVKFQKASGDVNMQILHSTFTQLLKVMPKKGANGL